MGGPGKPIKPAVPPPSPRSNDGRSGRSASCPRQASPCRTTAPAFFDGGKRGQNPRHPRESLGRTSSLPGVQRPPTSPPRDMRRACAEPAWAGVAGCIAGESRSRVPGSAFGSVPTVQPLPSREGRPRAGPAQWSRVRCGTLWSQLDADGGTQATLR